MDNETQLTSLPPGSKGNTFLENPSAASLSVRSVGKDGAVLGELNIDMSKLPHWQEYIRVVSGVSEDDVRKVLLYLEHAAQATHRA